MHVGVAYLECCPVRLVSYNTFSQSATLSEVWGHRVNILLEVHMGANVETDHGDKQRCCRSMSRTQFILTSTPQVSRIAHSFVHDGITGMDASGGGVLWRANLSGPCDEV